MGDALHTISSCVNRNMRGHLPGNVWNFTPPHQPHPRFPLSVSPAEALLPTPTRASHPGTGCQHPPCLTFDGDVSGQTLLLPAAPPLSLAHVIPLVPQLYGEHGEVQDPAVGRLLEGELAVQGDGVLVHAPAVQLPRPALLVRQGPRVEAVPPQTLVRVVVSSAAQGHLLLLLVLRGLEVHAEALRDGFRGTKTGTKVTQTTEKCA